MPLPTRDGGPAFPRQLPDITLPPEEALRLQKGHAGMSLRDYFAIHGDQPGRFEMATAAGVVLREFSGFKWDNAASQTLPTWEDWFYKLPESERYELYAKVRYAIADAMLKERAK